MKIVQTVTYVAADGAFGGPLSVAVQQCKALAERGHDVTLLGGWDGKLELRVPGVTVRLFPTRFLPKLRFTGAHTPGMLRWLGANRHDIDVLHVHAGRHLTDLRVMATARRLSIPYLVQTHGMITPKKSLPVRIVDVLMTRPALSNRTVFVLSEPEAEHVRAVEPSSSRVRINNGISLLPEGDRAPKSSPPEVLFLARLHPRKRVLDFARAAIAIAPDHPDVQFTVIGPDEGDLAELLHLIETSGTKSLRYEGTVEPHEAMRRMAEASLYVLPSVGELYPMSVLEALAAGTPVVITEDNAIAELLAESDAALVHAPTVDSLIRVIAEFIEGNAPKAMTPLAARLTADLQFGVADVCARLATCYEATCGIPAHSAAPKLSARSALE